jgi:hypothetical protein
MSQAEINIITIFRRISEAVESLSVDEIKRLSDPQYEVEVKAIRRRSKDELVTPVDLVNVDEIIKELFSSATRQDAQTYLDSKYSSKKLLELIARRLDIPILRQDKVEFLRDKIIETTVGARLRSRAIQGTGA